MAPKNVPPGTPGASTSDAAGKVGAHYSPQPYKAEPGETVQCKACGKMNAPDARFCDQCGAPLTGGAH